MVRAMARSSESKRYPASACTLAGDIDGEFHLGMDAAEYQIGAGFRKSHLHRFTRLLRAGVEIELRIEYPDVVGARVVVEDPQLVGEPDTHARRREALVVLRDRGGAGGGDR